MGVSLDVISRYLQLIAVITQYQIGTVISIVKISASRFCPTNHACLQFLIACLYLQYFLDPVEIFHHYDIRSRCFLALPHKFNLSKNERLFDWLELMRNVVTVQPETLLCGSEDMRVCYILVFPDGLRWTELKSLDV